MRVKGSANFKMPTIIHKKTPDFSEVYIFNSLNYNLSIQN